MASTNEAIIASLTSELAKLARKCHASVTLLRRATSRLQLKEGTKAVALLDDALSSIRTYEQVLNPSTTKFDKSCTDSPQSFCTVASHETSFENVSLSDARTIDVQLPDGRRIKPMGLVSNMSRLRVRKSESNPGTPSEQQVDSIASESDLASDTTSLVSAVQARPNVTGRRQPASADGHTLTERREACANAAKTRIGNLSSDCSTSEGGLYKGSSRPPVCGPSAKEIELDQPPSDSWARYLRIRELTSDEESNGKISRIGLRKGEFLIAKNSMVGDVLFADAFDMQRQCCYGVWKTL